MIKKRRKISFILIMALSAAICFTGCFANRSAVDDYGSQPETTDNIDVVIVTPLPNGAGSPEASYPVSETPDDAATTPDELNTPAGTENATEIPGTKTPDHNVVLKVDPEKLHSRSVMLKNIDTGKIMYELSASTRIYPASLTKMMTGLLAAEMLSADKKYEVTREAIERAYSLGASTGGFEPGEYTDKDGILGGILMSSAAECSFTAAIELCGSEEAFVELMNKRAQELGMSNTHFVNCTGLHNDDHYSTVEDLMKLAEHALRNPDYVRFFTLDTFKAYTEPSRKYQLTLTSTVFSGLANYDYGDVEILGGKTGYTRQAGLCLTTYSLYAGNHYILITADNDGNLNTDKYHFIDAEYIYRVLQEELR